MASPFQCLTSLKAHIGSCHVVRYDNKGRYILSAGSDRTIKLWSTSTSSSTPIKSYNSGHSYDILALDVTSDNSKFTSGGGDKNVLVWDVATSSILRRFSAHEGRIYDLKFAGVGAGGADVLITAGFDATLRFYDLRAKGAWRPIMESKEATDSIQCVQVQQHTVWTGCVDGIVRTYDLRMGQITQDTIDGQYFLRLFLISAAYHSNSDLSTTPLTPEQNQSSPSHHLKRHLFSWQALQHLPIVYWTHPTDLSCRLLPDTQI